MRIKEYDSFLEVVETKKDIIIYGAGWAGKLIHIFLRIHNIQTSAFAVTIQREKCTMDGIPVIQIDYAIETFPKACIILGVTSIHETDLVTKLKSMHTSDYIILSEPLLYDIRQEVLEYHAKHMLIEMRKDNSRLMVGYPEPGYLDTNYAERRLIIDQIIDAGYIALPKELRKIPCAGTEYARRMADFKILADACYCPEFIPDGVDIIHVFNMVCMIEKPWIASFETCLPRISVKSDFEKEYYSQMAEAITRDNCKGIFALCKNAYDIHSRLLRENVPLNIAENIMNKTKILHPPQKILILKDEFDKKHSKNQIHFIFIGNAFFVKGGREMLNVLSDYEDSYEFKLTIISSLQINDYYTHADYEDQLEIQNIIKNKKWIEHYANLPNERVIDKCREATIGLLPSMADTYGYAVLEMQASGCPVLTTNVRAFPEINNDECGWVCKLPVNELNMCSNRALPEISEQLKRELRKCFIEIFEKPFVVKEKGKKAMERIRLMHNPKKYSDTIQSLIC